MAQACVEIGLTTLNFTGMEAAFAALGNFKIPEMPTVPDPLLGNQLDPAHAKEKISSIVMSAIMKYMKLFILDPLEQIVDLFKNIVTAVNSIWDEVINYTLPGIGVKFMDFLTDLATRADAVIKEAVATISKIVDKFKPIQMPDPVRIDAKDPEWEAMQKVQAAIKEGVLVVLKKCMDIMKLVIDKVKLAFDLAGISLGEAIDQFFEMLTNIGELVNEGLTALMRMFGAAIDGAVAKWEDAKAAMRVFIAKIKTVFGIDVPGVPDIENTLSDKASNFWKEFVVLIQNWWSSFTSAVINVFTEAMNLFLEKVNAFLAYVDALASEAKTAFINAVNAITAGLMSAITGLPAQLTKLVEGKVTFCVEVPDIPEIQPDP